MSTANEIANCQLSLNKIVIDTIGGAMRRVLESCAKSINDNFEDLSELNSEDRLSAIIKLFGLTDEDTTKIINIKLPVKKTDGQTKRTPAKPKEKKIPVPFWIYYDKTTKKQTSTANPTLCQGLMAGLYNQCTNKPKAGCEYCTKCQKDAESNDGIPKRGNIELRTEQFLSSSYEYTPPGSDKPKKIYPFDCAIKRKFTEENFDEMLRENDFKLTPKGLIAIKFVPEKKVRSKKDKLTEDMSEKKGKKKTNEPAHESDDDEENDDDDDTASQYSEGTQVEVGDNNADAEDEDEDLEIPFADDDEDEDEAPAPKTKVKPSYSMDQNIMYESVSGTEYPGVIIAVHSDDDVPYYTIRYDVIEKGKGSIQKEKQTEENKLKPAPKPVKVDEPIADVTPFKTIKVGENERYAVLRDAVMTDVFEIYEVGTFNGPGKFTILSSSPIGTFDPEKAEISLYDVNKYDSYDDSDQLIQKKISQQRKGRDTKESREKRR
jgi:hypothetical protein